MIVGGTSTTAHLAVGKDRLHAKTNATSVADLYLNNEGGRVFLSSGGTGGVYANAGEFHAKDLYAQFGYITTQLFAENLNVADTLRATRYDLTHISQAGGHLYISPTIKFPNSGTTLTITKSTTALTIVVSDSSIQANMAGYSWAENSSVKCSLTIGDNVTGTMDGTLNSINVTSHTLSITVSGENWDSIEAGTYNASQFSDMSIMVYKRGDYRVGIWLSCYDIVNNSDSIRIYGGNQVLPNVMLGNLTNAGLGTINNMTPTGWGLFAQNAFLHGAVYATSGSIGGFTMDANTIHTTGLAVTRNDDGSIALSSDTNGFIRTVGGTSRSDLRFAIGSNFAVDNTGALYAYSGYIGCWNITQDALYSDGHPAYDTNANGIYMDDEYIAGGKQAQWYFKNDGSAKIGKMTLSTDGVLSVPAAEITGLNGTGRNLIINTAHPSITERPRLLEQTANTSIISSFTATTAPHGIRITQNGTDYPYYYLGLTGSMNGLIPGEIYTLSFDYECKLYSGISTSNTTKRYLGVWMYDNRNGSNANHEGKLSTEVYTGDNYGGHVISGRIVFTFTVPDATSIQFRIRPNVTNSGYNLAGDYIEIRNLMLEHGEYASDYVPALEDLSVDNIYTTGTTTINGGLITTGSITADQIAAGSITADKIATDAIKSKTYTYTSGNFSTTGTMFNLAGTGYIRSKNFAIDTSGNAYFKGNVEATSGKIGGWEITGSQIDKTNYNSSNKATNYIKIAPGSATNGDVIVLKTYGTPGNESTAIYPFYLHSDGFFHAENAEVGGDITATSGKIGSWSIKLDNGDGTSKYLNGIYASGTNAYLTRISVPKADSDSWVFQTATNTSYDASQSDLGWVNTMHITKGGGIYGSIFDSTTSGWKQIYANAIYSIDSTSNRGIRFGTAAVIPYNAVTGVDSNGQVALGSNTTRWSGIYSAAAVDVSSDRNLKTNISPFDSRHEAAYMELEPVTYMMRNFTATDSHDRLHYGFIAQDVESAFNNNGITTEEVGMVHKYQREEPNPAGELIEYSLSYTEMIALNTHMVQKAYREIETLKERITELENELENINSKGEIR